LKSKNYGRRIDLHTHSLLSDGVLLPAEILRRAEALNYEAIAITDHVDASNLESVAKKIVKIVDEMEKYKLKTKLYPGVELTHIPPESICKLAAKAKKLGILIVVVHGETLIEPVKPNTNHLAVECGEVDILAHPGLISFEDCELAKTNNVYLELTVRSGHCLTNGYVVKQAKKTGVKLLLNTDLHQPEDFISQEMAFKVALGAGLNEDEANQVVNENPKMFLRKIKK